MFKEKFNVKDWNAIRREVQKESFDADFSYVLCCYIGTDDIDDSHEMAAKPEWEEFFDEAFNEYWKFLDIDVTIRQGCQWAIKELLRRGWRVFLCPHCGEPVCMKPDNREKIYLEG